MMMNYVVELLHTNVGDYWWWMHVCKMEVI